MHKITNHKDSGIKIATIYTNIFTATNIFTNLPQISEFYNCKTLCSRNDFMKSVWLSDSLHTFSNNNGMAKLSKYIPQLGSFVQTSKFRASRNQNAINLIFKHGDFVYTIYTVSKHSSHLSFNSTMKHYKVISKL